MPIPRGLPRVVLIWLTLALFAFALMAALLSRILVDDLVAGMFVAAVAAPVIEWILRVGLNTRLATAAIAAAWISALSVESVTRVLADVHVRSFQARAYEDLLPGVQLAIRAVQWHLPWLLALVATVVVMLLHRRGHRWFMPAAVVVSTCATLMLGAASVTMVTSFSYCGDLFTAWTVPARAAGAPAAAADEGGASPSAAGPRVSPCNSVVRGDGWIRSIAWNPIRAAGREKGPVSVQSPPPRLNTMP